MLQILPVGFTLPIVLVLRVVGLVVRRVAPVVTIISLSLATVVSIQ